jgi:MFS family permease
MAQPILVSSVAVWQAFGLGLGNLVAGVLSERLRSRKRILYACLVAIPVATVAILLQTTPAAYAAVMLLLGTAQGYWSVYLTMGAEQFGTNVRALVSISVPNFVRVTTVPILLAMGALSPLVGWIPATAVIGVVVFALAFAGLWSLRETYDVDLDFLEPARTS